MRRRALLALPLLALPLPALAQAWPARPVRVIVPFPPGGTTDVVARLVTTRLSATLGQSFVIENRAGAGGTVGSDTVAKSPPDGHVFVISNIASHGVGPSVYRSMPYDSVRDFTHVALMAEVPSVLAVNVASPIRTLADFIAAAKARPGQITVASPGNGTSSHAKQEILKRSAGIETIHVPYRGSGPMMNDLMAGNVDAMITTLVEAGRNERFRLLAVTAAERVQGWPDLPTFRELGHDLVASTWFGISGPAGLPAPITERLNAEVLAALAHPEVAPRLVETGATPRRMSAAEYQAFVASEVARWRAVVQAANIRAE
jgi:tripartite-type tricarboxylate transporter receptor subunit TctC